jgi:hypothetical protein
MEGNDKVSKETATQPDAEVGHKKKRRGTIAIALLLGYLFLVLVIIFSLLLGNKPTEIRRAEIKNYSLDSWQRYHYGLPPLRYSLLGFRKLAQLSPEDQAKETATQFLEMCKQDRVQEAVDNYVEVPEDPLLPRFPWKDAMSSFFQNLYSYRVRDATLDTAPTPRVLWVWLETAVESEGLVNQENVFFPCSEDGSHIVGSQPILKYISGLNEETLTATQTVTAFLDACKNGRYKTTAQKYLPQEDVPQPNKAVPFQSMFDDVSAYTVFSESFGFDKPEVPSYRPEIDVYIRSKSGTTTSMRFIGNEDGSRIQTIRELPPPSPDEDVWSNSSQPKDEPAEQLIAEENQAAQTVTDFLNMCKQGQHEQATRQYLPFEYWPSQSSATQPAALDDISTYSIFNRSIDITCFDSPMTIITVDIQTTSSTNDRVDFVCQEDGLSIQKIVGSFR